MNNEILGLFLSEDCDKHAQKVLLHAIRTKSGTSGVKNFTFNRFNVRLNYALNEAVIDDEINPGDGEFRLPLGEFVSCVENAQAAY